MVGGSCSCCRLICGKVHACWYARVGGVSSGVFGGMYRCIIEKVSIAR